VLPNSVCREQHGEEPIRCNLGRNVIVNADVIRTSRSVFVVAEIRYAYLEGTINFKDS
jgi:hypothetical protein